MKYNLPVLIHRKMPAKNNKSKVPQLNIKPNFSLPKLILLIITIIVLLTGIILVGHQTFIYDNPKYVNVTKLLPEHQWRIRFKTSSPQSDQQINMIARQQVWHFSKYGYVSINHQSQPAYNYLTTHHSLKLENTNIPTAVNHNYLKFKLNQIHDNKKYVFKNVKTDTIPAAEQRNVKLTLIKVGKD